MGLASSKVTPEAAAAVKGIVENSIATNRIAIFSKSHCPYCTRAKAMLKGQQGMEILELNQRDDGSVMQSYLASRIGASRVTVPQIYINKELIGGCSDLEDLQRSGKLAELLA